jgi:tol-pal system protein YbgF
LQKNRMCLMNARVVAWAILIPTLLICGCWVKKEEGLKMQADIIALNTEFEVVKKAHAEEKAQLEARLKEADLRIAELKTLIEEYRRVTGRNAADIGVELEKTKTQIMELRGQLEVTQHKVEAIEKKLSNLHEDLSARTTETAARQDEGKHKPETKNETHDKNPLSGIKRPEKQEDFYKLAYGLFESGQYEASRTLFKEFLEKWPAGGYSDNALYWTGESFYVEKKYREAALTFQQVRERFPKGDKAADALLKLGYCFYQMEMYKEALPFLKEYIQSNPKSAQAAKAKEKIKEAEKKIK